MEEVHAKSPSLDAVRARIDAVDAELLRLVDERAALAHDVAEAKRAAGEDGRFGLRPAREAALLRGLLAAPGRTASPQLTVRLWREFISDSLAQQGPFHIAVWGGDAPARTVELARMRFGAAPPLTSVDDVHAALEAARSRGGVAVFALGCATPWWAGLVNQTALRVFASLPCLRTQGPEAALAVADVPVEPTGADETYWVSDAADAQSALDQAGITARVLAAAEGSRLFALEGFIVRDDPRLARAPGRVKGVIGAASTPFDL